MRREWPPWWMLLLGAMFLFRAGAIYYDNFFGPEMGWVLMPAQNSRASDYRRVASVVPGSGSDRAGFQVGDLVTRPALDRGRHPRGGELRTGDVPRGIAD